MQRLIAWYEREIAIAEGDPVSKWPWAFGRFSDGTAIAAAHRFLYREHPDLQAAFPDPYDATPGKATFLRWCDTEGRLRYPALLSARGLHGTPRVVPLRGSVSFGAALRLLLLLLSPRGGKALRRRVADVLHNEGFGGVARRLHRPR